MKTFGGKVLFLDRSDINTDEIIPAKYLTEVSKEALRPYLLEDLELEGFDPAGAPLQQAAVVISRANFGCGSSREHAPWALEVNGITVVIAESYARIFRQNMFNGGMLAIELSAAEIDTLFAFGAGKDTDVAFDFAASKLTVTAGGEAKEVIFELAPFDRALVEAGGWLEYADSNY